jgi:hypothetical protein
LKIMFGAVALVLLVVCVNIATLMLVRGSERQSEFAVRAALGGARTRLARQMLVECVALAVVGGARRGAERIDLRRRTSPARGAHAADRRAPRVWTWDERRRAPASRT